MSLIEESGELRRMIERICDERIKEKTRECFRTYKARVVTAPNGTVCRVRLVADNTVLDLPYISNLPTLRSGDMCQVAVAGGSFRNAFVLSNASFTCKIT